MLETFFAPAFSLWGSPVTWLELVAVALSLAMVGCNIREIHWGWPLAIAASLLYFALFWRSRLYGEAWLQIVFATVGFWGWTQWLRGKAGDGTPLRVHRLDATGWLLVLGVSLTCWPALGWMLDRWTDTDVPWWDAFPTALSLVGQVLLGRKLLENWLVWIAVNAVSVGLFAYKALWLTAGLYAVFIVLSVAGWRAWRRRLVPA
ncbi:MAG: Ribosyl nicotinamide transporter, PnuC-like [uncultured Ramlibacter sp.]|uniref:Nicotinamide riboside transporter PnuC n=1 Tax=uncultured Ramlibacter sp. TaxID=260755 RepID=A0A6J4NTL1_9BURK|nr:MAG: Ribosyl nicotinamide transporter, PnuC-like [uncultured Ramlibacter sp.]